MTRSKQSEHQWSDDNDNTSLDDRYIELSDEEYENYKDLPIVAMLNEHGDVVFGRKQTCEDLAKSIQGNDFFDSIDLSLDLICTHPTKIKDKNEQLSALETEVGSQKNVTGNNHPIIQAQEPPRSLLQHFIDWLIGLFC